MKAAKFFMAREGTLRDQIEIFAFLACFTV
jgi:hypothetical protein